MSAVVDIGLPHLFGLTVRTKHTRVAPGGSPYPNPNPNPNPNQVHTKQRVWDLAADTAADRDEWIRVLCQVGSLARALTLPRTRARARTLHHSP